MVTVTDGGERRGYSASSLNGNNIVFGASKDDLRLIGSSISFEGTQNILFIAGRCTLENSQLCFLGNNSVVYLCATSMVNRIKVNVFNESVLFVGENNYFNGVATFSLSERKHIIIGKNGMFSYNISLRTSDVHPIYSAESLERINLSKSIIVGDHVWIGQDALLLKGCGIGSGSVVGARAVCTKQYPVNSSIAGVPAHLIASDVFWNSTSVHAFSPIQTKQWAHSPGRNGIFQPADQPITVSSLDAELDSLTSADERLAWCQHLHCLGSSRFAYSDPSNSSLKGLRHVLNRARRSFGKRLHS